MDQSTDLDITPDAVGGLQAVKQALREQLHEGKRWATHSERLEQLIAENQALRQQLVRSQRLAALGTMSAMVAHEFNNILTPIISYAQMAQRNPSMTAKALDRAFDGGQRATDICRAILGLARDEPAEPVRVNLGQLISDTLLAIGRDPKRDAIEIVIRTQADLAIMTRKVELQQVLMNLLLNARAAVLAKSGPRRIEISASAAGSDVVIRVSDNGVGIERENFKRIFEPFFTTKASPDGKPGGHGLGLAVCREIVQSLKGEISVESTPGCGATFTLLLPALQIANS
jgi:signal transduction histidine kinase